MISSEYADQQSLTLTTGIDYADDQGSFRNGTETNPGTPTSFKFTDKSQSVEANNLTATEGDTLFDNWTTDNDVLNLSLKASDQSPEPILVENIENINVKVTEATSAVAGEVNLSNFSGVKNIAVSGTTKVAVDLTVGGDFTAIGDTGVTKIDATGLLGKDSSLIVSSANAENKAAMTITGGAGADLIAGADQGSNKAGDTISGGAADDTIFGLGGKDTLNGDAGRDNINGGAGNDTISGGDGNDVLGVQFAISEGIVKNPGGGFNEDNLIDVTDLFITPVDGGSSESGVDLAFLESGNDFLESGNDFIDGGAGDDFIFAGTGADKMTGGTGDDTFVFVPNDGLAPNVAGEDFVEFNTGADHVTDFSEGDAILFLDTETILSFDDIVTLVNSGVKEANIINQDYVSADVEGFTEGNAYYVTGTFVDGVFTDTDTKDATDLLVFVANDTNVANDPTAIKSVGIVTVGEGVFDPFDPVVA